MPPDQRADEPNDRTLIRRFLEGDEAAFRQLHSRHTPRLRMTMRRLLGQQGQEVDDVVQDTWLAGCRGMHAFNGTAQFSSWLTTIGIRAAFARFPLRDTAPEALDEVVAPPGPTAATVIDLERALARLPDRQRAVVLLHDVEGFTHEEIAQRLAMAVGTSKATLFRARHALRRMLTDGESE